MTRKATHWLPYTQMKKAPDLLKVKSGDGIMLELEDGRKIMDCISSWWVTLHGHGQKEVAQAIAKQAATLEQVIFAGYTHEPVDKMAELLVPHLPEKLQYLFYTDDGSTAVEAGLKMALQYWTNLGHQGKNRFVSFEGAYHGDTFGVMSLGERSVFTEAFDSLLFPTEFIEYPETFIGDSEVKEKENRSIQQLEKLFQEKGDSIAGVLIEPLIQGTGGMKMCRPEYLRKLEKVVRKNDSILIYDEVLTGFGRTGDWFASIKSKTNPDIICLSKGITGGFLPLGVTVANDRIFQAFWSDDPHATLFHGHSYTANPIACAASVASLQLLEKTEHRFRDIEQWHYELLPILQNHPKLTKFRICGTIMAMDIITEEKDGYLNSLAPVLKAKFLEKGFLLRPLGNVLYILPPYCVTQEQLEEIYQAIYSVLDQI
ncbi:MAG: adenosylmethionine-8-amino-7-oxononanoate aminotransferase [bacterium]|jgi:adenosylmethionine-8-amino-7-oxononanoate aminotransferase